MKNFLPAVCYHPTTVLSIDDNRKFLETFRLDLDCEKAAYRFFDQPRNAINFLTQEYKFDPFVNHCMGQSPEEELDCPGITTDIRKIHREIYNRDRFAQVSVAIIDYAMHELNGVELCQKIKDLPLKKVMLTGEANDRLAVNAFNEGLIHKFVRKDTPNFSAAINEIISELQIAYFRDLSQPIIESLTKTPYSHSAFLTDHVFSDFFAKICQNQKVAEYYLMDGQGTFMFLDLQGKASWLVVKNEEEMRFLTEFAVDTEAPSTVIHPLNMRTHIPYFHSDEELQTSPENWEKYFHPAQKLVGKNTYYYALITNSKAYPTDKKITSFEEYAL